MYTCKMHSSSRARAPPLLSSAGVRGARAYRQLPTPQLSHVDAGAARRRADGVFRERWLQLLLAHTAHVHRDQRWGAVSDRCPYLNGDAVPCR